MMNKYNNTLLIFLEGSKLTTYYLLVLIFISLFKEDTDFPQAGFELTIFRLFIYLHLAWKYKSFFITMHSN